MGATSPLARPPSLISTKKRRTNISVVGGSFSVHCLVMENRPFFHVDSKSYEIMREGNSKGINIIKRGRNHQSNVVLAGSRPGSMKWPICCQTTSSKKLSVKVQRYSYFKKKRNERGRYVCITEFGVTKGRGYVIILEGRDSWGWRGFS